MHRLTFAATTVLVSFLLYACEDGGQPTAPASQVVAGGKDRLVQMKDACDPQTFNAALGGEPAPAMAASPSNGS